MAQSLNTPSPLVLTGNVAANWKIFKQNLEIYITASTKDSANDKVKVALLLNFVGQEGLDLYNTFTFEQGEEVKFKAVLDAFQDFATPKKNEVYERYVFNNRCQQHGETFDHFTTDLKKLAKSCEYGDLNDSIIRDRIIIGVNNQALRESLLRLDDQSLTKVIQHCQTAERSKQQAQQIGSSNNYNRETHEEDDVNVVTSRTSKPQKSWTKNRSASIPKFTKNGPDSSDPAFSCRRCRTMHKSRQCPAYNRKCLNCGMYNHFAVACRKKRVNDIQVHEQYNAMRSDSSDDDVYVSTINVILPNEIRPIATNKLQSSNCTKPKSNPINSVQNTESKNWYQTIQVENKSINFKLDTGASVNIIPKYIFQDIKTDVKPLRTPINLETYGGGKIKPLGIAKLHCSVNGKGHYLDFVIVDLKSKPLLGLSGCKRFDLIKRVDSVQSNAKEQFLKDNHDVFDGSGKFPGKYKIVIPKDSIPEVRPPRRHPSSLKGELKNTLLNLVNKNIIAKVDEPNENQWISNLVIVEKPNGKLRVCLDPQALNKVIIKQHHLLPSVSDISEKLSFKKYYTVLDLKESYYQVELDEPSSDLCCFSTPFGVYKFLRLPFGVSCASESFQKKNEESFKDIPNVLIYQDDILCAGETEEEHDKAVKQVLQRARELNIKFNKDKLQYKQNKVKYVGHIFCEKGMSVDGERIRALVSLAPPKNKKELQRHLGMFNFVRQFVPDMATIISPLRELLCKDVLWQWLPIHQIAFNKLKISVSTAPVLANFDASKKQTLQCDASQDGIGCCLMQDGKPVAYASRSMTSNERNMAQVEKELLSIVYGVTKFHNFVYGYDVDVITDHKPLIPIMNKPICKIGSTRLQRFRLKLLKYSLNVKYLPGKFMYVADNLSRSYLQDPVIDDPEMFQIVHTLTSHLPMSEARKKQFVDATEKDEVLKTIKGYYLNGWPVHKSKVPNAVLPYWKLRSDISYEQGILFLSERIIVPIALQSAMLAQLHEGHLGRDKTIARARQLFFWHGMSSDVERTVAQCRTCEKFQPLKVKAPLIPQVIPELRFDVIALDILQNAGRSYLILVDYFSKWLEILPMTCKTASSVITVLKDVFATHGIPRVIRADNMPFQSQTFCNFAEEYNIKIITCSPHFHRSNGLAEKGCHIAGIMLNKSRESKTDIRDLLLEYRNTPLSGLDVSPSQLLMSRTVRTKLPVSSAVLQPKVQITTNIHSKMLSKQNETKHYHDKSARKYPDTFQIGDNVNVKITKGDHWEPAIVKGIHPTPRSYIIQKDGVNLRRNEMHIKSSYVTRSGRTVRPPQKLDL